MKGNFRGRVWKLGDDIDTDIIIPTQFLALKSVEDMKKYAFYPLRPELAELIQPGDIIVAGKNFALLGNRHQRFWQLCGSAVLLLSLMPEFFIEMLLIMAYCSLRMVSYMILVVKGIRCQLI